jgi:hypothetical protein
VEAEEAKHWYGAAFHLRQLLRGDPDNPELRQDLGAALYRGGYFAEAVAHLTGSIRRDGQGDTRSLRLLLALAQYRLDEQRAVATMAGLSAAPHAGFVPVPPILLVQQSVARQQLAQALHRIEAKPDLDSGKDDDLRKEAEALLKPGANSSRPR